MHLLLRTAFLFITFALTTTISAQPIIFPLDTNAVTIDGILNLSEWQYAETATIVVNSTDNVEVKYKHDGTAMYFAFSGKLESANVLFPEILTDAQNLGGSYWSPGQWWLHVSATDCENNGSYGVYNDCKATQPGWEGTPNFISGLPNTDTVELRIPFSKIGFNPATMDTMGIAMMVTNTATIFKLNSTGANKDAPASWSKAVFSKFYADISKVREESNIKFYPNPVNDVLHLSGVTKGATISISDMAGRVLFKEHAKETTMDIAVSYLVHGIYTVRVINANGLVNTMLFTKAN